MPDPHAAIRSTLEQRFAAVLKQHRAATRSRGRVDMAKNLAIAGLGAGLAWAIWNNNKLAEKAEGKEVVYATVQANGEMISSVHYSEVAPSAKQEEAVQNALWQYVMARECYSVPGFPRQSYIAQAMSEARVGGQVHRQFDLSNPQAPQHLYGEHGVNIQCELADPPTPMGSNGDIYFFRFRRWEDNGRLTPQDIAAAPFYSVSLRFRTGIYPDDKRRGWVDRSTFNAPGVQVLDYPGAQPDNARPAIRVSQRDGGSR